MSEHAGAEPRAALDELLEFVEELRDDFEIGLDELIAVQELLLALAARNELPEDLARLEGYLAPILCSSRREQQDFGPRYRNWLESRVALREERGKVTPREPDPLPRWNALRSWDFTINWFAGAILAFAAVAVLAWKVNDVRVKQAATAVASAKPAEIEPPPDAGTAGNTPGPAEPAGSVEPATPPVEPPTPTPKPPVMPDLAPLAVLAVLGSLGVLILRKRLRREHAQAFLSRSRARAIPDSETTLLRLRSLSLVTAGAAQTASAVLRRRRPIAETRLDLDATMRRTAESAGHFTEVRALRTGVPEYLFLIDRRSRHDLASAHFEQWLDALAKNGVHVLRYFFDRDPSLLFPRDSTRPPLLLHELKGRYPAHRIGLFAELCVLTDLVPARAEHVLTDLNAWHAPVLLTPERPENWGAVGEALRAAGVRVAHADAEGLAAAFGDRSLAGVRAPVPAYTPPVPAVFRENTRRWLAPDPPTPSLVAQAIHELRRYLGELGHFWFSACAMYPQLRWPLALELGVRLAPGTTPDLSEPARRLVSLPWSRAAHMPDWLRERLIRELSPAEHQAAQHALQLALVDAAQRDPQGQHLEIQQADQQLVRSLFERLAAHWEQADDDLPSPCEDRVFLGSMRTGAAVAVPRLVRAAGRSARERAHAPLPPRSLAEVFYGAVLVGFVVPALPGGSKAFLWLVIDLFPSLARRSELNALFLLLSAALWIWLGTPTHLRTVAKDGDRSAFRAHLLVLLRVMAISLPFAAGVALGPSTAVGIPYIAVFGIALALWKTPRARAWIAFAFGLLPGVLVLSMLFVLVSGAAAELHHALLWPGVFAGLYGTSLLFSWSVAPSLLRRWGELRSAFDRWAPDRLLFEESTRPFATWPKWASLLAAASLGFAFGSAGYALSTPITETPLTRSVTFALTAALMAAFPHFAALGYLRAGRAEPARRAVQEAALAALVALAVWQPSASVLGVITVFCTLNGVLAWIVAKLRQRHAIFEAHVTAGSNGAGVEPAAAPLAPLAGPPRFWTVAYAGLFLLALSGPVPSALRIPSQWLPADLSARLFPKPDDVDAELEARPATGGRPGELAEAGRGGSSGTATSQPEGQGGTSTPGNPSTGAGTGGTAGTQTTAVALRPRIYIHIAEEADRPFAQGVSQSLTNARFTVVGIHNIQKTAKPPRSTEVRYYKKVEADGADRIVQALKQAGIGSARAVYLALEDNTAVRPNHYEVWFPVLAKVTISPTATPTLAPPPTATPTQAPPPTATPTQAPPPTKPSKMPPPTTPSVGPENPETK